jgi:hypothetical protein
MEALAPFGDALRIGSTPEIILIAVGSDDALPSVATNITASPLLRSEIESAGMRLSIC